MAQPLLEEPQAQKQYLRDFAAALSSQAAGLADGEREPRQPVAGSNKPCRAD